MFLGISRFTVSRVEQNKLVTQEITKAETDKAISRLRTNKVPGGDGFPAEWYKLFRDVPTPMLLKGGETVVYISF